MPELVCIAIFDFPHEAQMAKSKLEASDILAFIHDEHSNNAYPLAGNLLGGIKLVVPSSLLEQSLEVLNTDFSEDVEKVFGKEMQRCPHCNSLLIKEEAVRAVPIIYFILLFMFVPFKPNSFFKKKVTCQDCNKVI